VLELSDPQIIDALLVGFIRTKRRVPKTTKPERGVIATLPDRKECRCGTCSQCIENERWEAVFNAKFADPDYYKARPVRHSSSLERVR